MIETPLALRTYIEGLKTHDIAMIAATVSEELRFVSAGRTLNKSQFLEMLRALYTAFPDWWYEHSDPEARGDVFAIRWRQGGTHLGTFALAGMEAIEPTGRSVAICEQYFFYKIANEQIAEIRPDPIPGGAPQGILEQIGVSAPPL